MLALSAAAPSIVSSRGAGRIPKAAVSTAPGAAAAARPDGAHERRGGALPAPPGRQRDERSDRLILEDFEASPVGELPRGWRWEDADSDLEKPYEVVEEDGNKYLKARDHGESVVLGKEIDWDLDDYPYLSFRVRVHEIPEGGDERYDETVDSAAGIYVTYSTRLFGTIPVSVKYVWSSTLPVGAAARRAGIGRPWQIVFGSGRQGLGEWRTYVFDLRDAYRSTFGGEPPRRPVGIGMLSDANSTGTRAYADYDDLVVLRTAPPGTTGGVERILGR